MAYTLPTESPASGGIRVGFSNLVGHFLYFSVSSYQTGFHLGLIGEC